MEYYIYNIPVFLTDTVEEEIDIPSFCTEVEEILPPSLMRNIDVVYIGSFKELGNRNAAYTHGAIYISNREPTNADMVENFIHEAAHALEPEHGWDIYDKALQSEFRGKRHRLRDLLTAHGYEINPALYDYMEYNRKFDEFLADEVGYPTLLSITMGLFASPYGATSLPEYFANGFEKYFLDSPESVKNVSPILYNKIETILNDKT